MRVNLFYFLVLFSALFLFLLYLCFEHTVGGNVFDVILSAFSVAICNMGSGNCNLVSEINEAIRGKCEAQTPILNTYNNNTQHKNIQKPMHICIYTVQR